MITKRKLLDLYKACDHTLLTADILMQEVKQLRNSIAHEIESINIEEELEKKVPDEWKTKPETKRRNI